MEVGMSCPSLSQALLPVLRSQSNRGKGVWVPSLVNQGTCDLRRSLNTRADSIH